jgi:glycosyltransferase involved in cell wall biosynthesis
VRILTVANDLVPYGGLERMQVEIHEQLAARGHENVLVHEVDGSLTPRWERCTVHRRQVASTRLLPRRPGRSIRGLVGLREAITATRPDVVYVHHYRHVHLVAPAARRARVPLVLHLHAAAPASLGPLGRRAVAAPALVLAVSAHTADVWRRWREGIEVVRNGVDLAAFAPADPARRSTARAALGLPEGAFVVGFAGRITAEKGVETLTAAWRSTGWAPERARLLVAGAGTPPLEATLRQGAAPGIELVGFLDDPRQLYAAADVMAVPSTWADPCPRSVLESLAAGRAVLGSRIGGIPELVDEECGVVVDPGDADALARALVDLERDRERVAQLGKAGRVRAEAAFDLQTCVDLVERSLHGVTGIPA